MNKRILVVLAATALSFAASLVQAQSSNLCQLPVGHYEGKSVLIQDKATGLIEQYVLELNVVEGGKANGQFRLFDVSMDEKGELKEVSKNRYFFQLEGCSAPLASFRIKSLDIDGYIRILDINRTFSEITVSGAINTYEEGFYGWRQWLYDSLLEMTYGESSPEIDFRRLPIRLRKKL